VRRFQSVPNFEGKSLNEPSRPRASDSVTDDFGDERTGIVLDHQIASSHEAGLRFGGGDARRPPNHVLSTVPSSRNRRLFSRALLEYARDKAISAERWHELEANGGELRSLVSS